MTTEATRTDDGGQAFPSPAVEGHHPQQPGMSLRDWFAGQAMASMLSGCVGLIGNSQDVTAYASGHCNSAVVERAWLMAERAWLMADLMLARRKAVPQ